MTTRTRATRAGFTLIEMMTVVVLVGVLATLATYGVRRYILSAKTGEAVSMITNIRAAEEAYKDETFTYLDVSNTFADDKFYPTSAPGTFKTQWGGAGPDATVTANFKTLGIQADAPVQFTYAVVARGPGASLPELPSSKKKADFSLPNPTTRWTYVVVAKANLDGNTAQYCYVVSHSLSNETYIENEGL